MKKLKKIMVNALICSMLLSTSINTFAKDVSDSEQYLRAAESMEYMTYSVDIEFDNTNIEKEENIAKSVDSISKDFTSTSSSIIQEKEDNDKKAAQELANQQNQAKYQDINIPAWDGSVLTPSKGVNNGPSGKETYYNLPMGGVVSIMRNQGFSEEEYPYWVREDGVKMLGPYVMVAANLDLRPRGSTIETSLGMGLVCDTGGFAVNNPTQLDIAVDW